MANELPPLPEPARVTAVQFCDDGYWFTAARAIEQAHGICAAGVKEPGNAGDQRPT